MQLTVPNWAAACKNENLLVLIWFMKRLARLYPDTKEIRSGELVPGEMYRRQKKYFSKFGFYPQDINNILQTKLKANKLIEREGLLDYIDLAELTGYTTMVTMQLTHTSTEVEIRDQKCIEIVCYLTGCLNRNLIEDERPQHFYNLDTSVKGRFNWQGQNE
jgi:hypothetical protein